MARFYKNTPLLTANALIEIQGINEYAGINSSYEETSSSILINNNIANTSPEYIMSKDKLIKVPAVKVRDVEINTKDGIKLEFFYHIGKNKNFVLTERNTGIRLSPDIMSSAKKAIAYAHELQDSQTMQISKLRDNLCKTASMYKALFDFKYYTTAIHNLKDINGAYNVDVRGTLNGALIELQVSIAITNGLTNYPKEILELLDGIVPKCIEIESFILQSYLPPYSGQAVSKASSTLEYTKPKGGTT